MPPLTSTGYLVVQGRRLRDASVVGHKFARQAELIRHGLPVPPFFCLSAHCHRVILRPYRSRVDEVLRGIDYADPASVAAASATLRALVLDTPWPSGLAEAVLRTFDRVFGPDAVVSVRSSTVGTGTGGDEDSTTDAYAGMSDSFLDVTRDGLLAHIARCWASAYNPEALLYRHARAAGPTRRTASGASAASEALDAPATADPAHELAVAVGVQRMIPGERSFVLFTADPTSGARNPVIAAGLGNGEGVVQERVPLDHYFVDRATGEIRTRPAEPSSSPVLTDAQVAELVELGGRIEWIFGQPQDIEGTVDAAGRVHVLQSRPIVLDWARQRLWSNANITESFPGVSSVLTYTFARRFYRSIFTDFYRLSGVRAAELRWLEPELDRMIGRLRGRIYYSLSEWYRLHRTLPLFPAWRAAWERMMGIDRTSPDGRRDAFRRTPSGLLRVAGAVLRTGWLAVTHDRAMRDFAAWWSALFAPRRAAELDPSDPLALVDDFHQVWREVGRRWGRTLVNDLLLTSTTGLATALFARWVPAADPALASDLLCGDEENHSVAAMLSLVDLAERVRANPALHAAMMGDPDAALWREVSAGRYGAAIAERFRDHLDRYGDRGLQELKLERPNPRQRPEQLLRVVAGYASGELTVAGLRAEETARRADGERRLARLLAGRPLRRRILAAVLARQRRYIRYREDSRYCRSELFGHAKRTFAALGVALADRGVLADPRDVVHLTEDEVLGYFDGTGPARDLAGLAAVRRAESGDPGPEPPMHFATMGAVPDHLPAPSTAGNGRLLHGIGSSSGTVRGTARVVLDPDDAPPPADDLILVARETDPGWLFLMLSARGIVVERGTLLSHTAITGRKFGIPTVVAVAGATSRIPDGATIELDGARGTVTVLEPPPSVAAAPAQPHFDARPARARTTGEGA